MNAVLDLKAFDLEKTLERDSEFLDIDAEHVHDETISSLGIREDGDVDLDAFEEYLGKLLREKGNDLYRIKGVIAVAGASERFVYQAVHVRCFINSKVTIE